MNLFIPPPIDAGHLTPRPYQVEALDALNLYLQEKDGNPCVVIPTGGGKSVLMAWAIQGWKRDYPPFRCAVAAHRKELVQQNADELHGLWPGGDIGVYSAGLQRRDTDHAVLFASIDSIFKRWGEFPPFDCIIIDEAHRIPASGEGKYRKFIKGCRSVNPNVKIVGFTATPFRMGCGPICHKDHILNEVCYEANVGDLIRDGYLCRLRSKIGDVQPDLTDVTRNHGGDYIVSSLGNAVKIPDVIVKAVSSAATHIRNEARKSVLWFCVDIQHCKQVQTELRKYGVDAPMITGKTPQAERDKIARGFVDGRYQHLLNVNVFTEGFNAKRVDCIVLLRPTLSKGLFSQMVGRGLRLHPEKDDCLVLDYGHCIDEHGPIDCLDAGKVVLYVCGNCGDVFSRAVRRCPHCEWEIPKQEIERAEAEEREKRLHEAEASKRSILGSEPETVVVDDVTVHRHTKPGRPDSIRVEYRCGLSVFREWICLGHGGFAEKKARHWWWLRFGQEGWKITVEDALADMFLPARIKEVTKTITIQQRGKHAEIVDYDLNVVDCKRRLPGDTSQLEREAL